MISLRKLVCTAIIAIIALTVSACDLAEDEIEAPGEIMQTSAPQV